ncbi:Hypothetical protein, putative [Bodo saltans]|uniref:Uncharacterized protein n=1 Tax=Bodo saltans TaxID=75058 RepID=A0A0S4J257_BODSA|nr:Hypothetical protein, putative [Bodo saltans]|eukprot:CUG59063.1 Hypothetical protein, putative [Bodo saltans]
MNEFNPKQMLQHSSSERINVWMGAGDTLHSVKVSADEAMGCYSAGCGLYFRANDGCPSHTAADDSIRQPRLPRPPRGHR